MKKILVMMLALCMGLVMMTACGGKGKAQEAEAADGYVVIVMDKDNAPVKDVDVQLCDDRMCLSQTTDEAGYAKFETEEGEYKLKVLNVPEGFAADDTEYDVSGSYGVTMVVLNAE